MCALSQDLSEQKCLQGVQGAGFIAYTLAWAACFEQGACRSIEFLGPKSAAS